MRNAIWQQRFKWWRLWGRWGKWLSCWKLIGNKDHTKYILTTPHFGTFDEIESDRIDDASAECCSQILQPWTDSATKAIVYAPSLSHSAGRCMVLFQTRHSISTKGEMTAREGCSCRPKERRRRDSCHVWRVSAHSPSLANGVEAFFRSMSRLVRTRFEAYEIIFARPNDPSAPSKCARFLFLFSASELPCCFFSCLFSLSPVLFCFWHHNCPVVFLVSSVSHLCRIITWLVCFTWLCSLPELMLTSMAVQTYRKWVFSAFSGILVSASLRCWYS